MLNCIVITVRTECSGFYYNSNVKCTWLLQLSPGGLSPQTPTAPEPLPLSKELADAAATEKVKPTEPENNDGRLGDLHFKLR